MLRRCVEQQRISLSEHFGGARAGGAFLPRVASGWRLQYPFPRVCPCPMLRFGDYSKLLKT